MFPCINSTLHIQVLHSACRTSECPGLLVEPLKVKGGVVEQWVLHLHFPCLQEDREGGKDSGLRSSLSEITSFHWLQNYAYFHAMFVHKRISF